MRFMKIAQMAILCGLLLSGSASMAGAGDLKRLVIPGSGACEQVLLALADAFNTDHPETEVIIPKSTGTNGGVKAVETGSHPLARVGRPLRVDELAKGLTFIPFAYDAVVFAVGKNVGLNDLSASQLADIFSGRITSWQEIGGPQQPIRVMTRQADETSLVTIRRNLPALREVVITQQAKMAFHDYEMVALLNKYPAGIGFLTSSSVVTPGNRMQAVGIDGVQPTAANLISGAYPLKATYGLICKAKPLKGLSDRWVNFVFSAAGEKIIGNLGLTPTARNR